jgi:hypothetical protein
MSTAISRNASFDSDYYLRVVSQFQWRMAMEKRNSLVKKPSVLLAAALVLISTGMASAATRQHARSSTNVQDAVGSAGYAAPHEVPENGGAASMIQPGSTPNWR